ncbi:MAG: S41 family peptidase, partial [Candidatus Sulfotelmatobacter sp.]
MARSSRRSLFLVVFFLLACGFLGIVFAQRTGQQSSLDSDSDVKDSLKQFADVYAIVEDNYAEPVNPDKAIY